jgi:hypothetical protein
MKTHKIKHGGEFTIIGYDESFRTYCGLNETCSEDVKLVDRNGACTCKRCQRGYEKELQRHEKKIKQWKDQF